MSAVKPALEAISKGWQAEVSSTLITFDDKSDRSEMSGRKVSTKLTLFLTENSATSSKNKVVLHFYHTSSTLQAQCSSLLSCGISSPVWRVKNFLEPLATAHAYRNSAEIEAINSNIRQSASFTCGFCRDQINPTATHPKDQELSCNKCGKLFHKKCTDRKKTTANWKRNPWYCQDCFLPPQSNHSLPDHGAPPLNPAARIFQPQEDPLSQTQFLENTVQSQVQLCNLLSQDTQRVQLPLLPAPPLRDVLQSRPELLYVQEQHQPEPVTVQPRTNHPPTRPAFPTTSSRQRSSNINLENPEFEFQKTALAACRSNIA